MNISPYFRNLRSAYNAEIDDLTFDSEGLNVLGKRLKQQRKEIGFLVNMLELSPEMVAVVFHQGFRFKSAAAMDHLLTHESDELPEWDSLTHAIELEPWTQDLVQVVMKQPMGEWFLTVAAGLEYMRNKPDGTPSNAKDHDEDDREDSDTQHGARDTDGDDDNVDSDARVREEAGADWMVEQGFDRKD